MSLTHFRHERRDGIAKVFTSTLQGEQQMKFNKPIMAATAAALSLGLVACDGPTEERMEDQGEQMESQMDAEAEAMEDAGAPEAQVEAMEDNADAVEDTMEEQADTVGEEMDGNEM